MKIQAIATTAFAGAFVLTLLPTKAEAKKQPKVEICHYTDDGDSHIIEVSGNAVSAHIANHGDHVVGDETCDGIDNDCNGLVDDGIAPEATACGVGECAAVGELTCVDGELVDSCTAGMPSEEVCDAADNDCNGVVDDGVPEPETSCGVGECGRFGVLACLNGAQVDTCQPGTPVDEICTDGADNNCDGQVDESCVECPCLTDNSFFEFFVDGMVPLDPGVNGFCAQSASTGLVFIQSSSGGVAAGGEAGSTGSGSWACESSGGRPTDTGFVPGISEAEARYCGQLILDALVASGIDPATQCSPW